MSNKINKKTKLTEREIIELKIREIESKFKISNHKTSIEKDIIVKIKLQYETKILYQELNTIVDAYAKKFLEGSKI